MESGRWVWDDGKKALKFEKDKSKSYGYDLKAMEKFRYKFEKNKTKLDLVDEQKDRIVKLSDIKRVALEQITEDSLNKASQSTTRLFDSCYKTEAMDTLLWCMLNYYMSLLNYRAASADEGLESEGEVARKAKAHLQECNQCKRQCESDLSAAYVLLVSGISMDCTHHNQKGQLRYSRTLLDQQFFEILYEFLMIVTWVTFSYQNWEDIHTEIGRILRLDAFNRDIPLATPTHASGQTRKLNEQSISAKVWDNRPEFGSLRKLRSPLVEVLYPTLQYSKSLGSPIPKLSESAETTRMGIIGDKYSNYYPETLKLRDEVILQRQLEEEMKLLEEEESSQDSDDELDALTFELNISANEQ